MLFHKAGSASFRNAVREARVLNSHRWPIFMIERIMEEVCHGAVLQALRERRARQERTDARPAALLVQGVWPEFHQYAPTRQAAGPEGGCRAALCQRPVHEPHRQAARRLGPTVQAWLEQFAAAYAQKPEPEGRAVVIELDEMWHYLKKSPSRSGSGKLGIVLQGSWWTGNAAVVTRPPASACLSG